MPSLRMFATGTTKNIDVWDIASETSRSFRPEFRSTLSVGGHSDICRDILVIDKEPFMLMVSCGMDGKVMYLSYIYSLISTHLYRPSLPSILSLSLFYPNHSYPPSLLYPPYLLPPPPLS